MSYVYSHNCTAPSKYVAIANSNNPGRSINYKTFLSLVDYQNEMYGFTREDIILTPHAFSFYIVRRKNINFVHAENSCTNFIYLPK